MFPVIFHNFYILTPFIDMLTSGVINETDVVKSINATSANVKYFRNAAHISYSKNQASKSTPEYLIIKALIRNVVSFMNNTV